MPGTSYLSSMAMSFRKPPSHSIRLMMKTPAGLMVERMASRATVEVFEEATEAKQQNN